MAKKGIIFEKKPVKALASAEGTRGRTLRVTNQLDRTVENLALRNGISVSEAYRLLIEKGMVAVDEGNLSDHLIKVLAKNSREVRAVRHLSRVNYRLIFPCYQWCNA